MVSEACKRLREGASLCRLGEFLGNVIMSLLFRVAATTLVLAVPTAANAAWHKASSKHFVIFADEDPKKLQSFATKLEKFDQGARAIMLMSDPPVGDGNRLTVFVLPTDADVRKLAGDTTGFLKGFYTGRARGSLVYVPKRIGGRETELGLQSIFYHEYAHHLMMQQLDQPYPEWYVEGFAEFLSTPNFEKDGSIGLGAPPLHRAWGLYNGKSLPLETLLAGKYSISTVSKEERESIYGRGWLLVHYLIMEPKREGQLNRYVLSIAQGTPPAEAARSAFGDLAELDKDLGAYLNKKRLTYFKVGAAKLQTGPIEVTPLSPGAAEVILLRARMKKGGNDVLSATIAAEVRRFQSRYAGDELVETTLAEAELESGNHEAAEAAADRAMKANPQSAEAMVIKGRAIVERAASASGDSSAQFALARKLFIAANKIDPEDPEPLMEYYIAHLRDGVRPTANAIAALHYASNLAPQDLGLRMNSAMQYLRDGKLKEARVTLAPVAYSPHGGRVTEEARRMIGRIDAGDAKGALRAPRSNAAPTPDGS